MPRTVQVVLRCSRGVVAWSTASPATHIILEADDRCSLTVGLRLNVRHEMSVVHNLHDCQKKASGPSK
jgi:hypothetical protein